MVTRYPDDDELEVYCDCQDPNNDEPSMVSCIQGTGSDRCDFTCPVCKNIVRVVIKTKRNTIILDFTNEYEVCEKVDDIGIPLCEVCSEPYCQQCKTIRPKQKD